MKIKRLRKKLKLWVARDFFDNPKRFALEIVAWALCVGNAVTMAVTLPNPPLFPMYCAWVLGYLIYAYCAWSRRSFGLFINFVFLFLIDVFGFYRVILTM